jgi:hypothetical protein
MTNSLLIKIGGVIDFYVSKEKFNGLKTEKGKMNYIHTELQKCFNFMKGKTFMGINIRYCNIDENDFWGNIPMTVNDIGYNVNNKLPKRKDDKLTFRVFQVKIIGEVINNPTFIKVTGDNFLFSTGNYEVF